MRTLTIRVVQNQNWAPTATLRKNLCQRLPFNLQQYQILPIQQQWFFYLIITRTSYWQLLFSMQIFFYLENGGQETLREYCTIFFCVEGGIFLRNHWCNLPLFWPFSYSLSVFNSVSGPYNCVRHLRSSHYVNPDPKTLPP